MWVYQDLESLNGTWINGTRIRPSGLTIVRPGDVLEVADLVLKISVIGDPPKTLPRSVLVFRNLHFKAEFRFVAGDSIVQFGGDKPDFSLLGGDVYPPEPEDEDVMIVAQGESFGVESSSDDLFSVKGRKVGSGEALADNDELGIGPWTVVINDENSTRRVHELSLGGPGSGQSPEEGVEGRTHRGASTRPSTFGKVDRARSDTVSFSREEVQAIVTQVTSTGRRTVGDPRALRRSWTLIILATFSLVGAAALLIMALLAE
jgi:hypothetical protein